MAFCEQNTLILVLTYRCNMACDYCVVEKRELSMTREIAEKALAGFLSTSGPGPLRVRLFGGEPFLEFPLVERIVDYVKQNTAPGRVAMDVTTNATLFNAENLSFLKNHPELELILSVDGPDSTNAKHRKGGVSIAELMARHGGELLSMPSLSVNKVVSPDTVETLAEDFLYVAELGFRRVNILPAYYTNWSGAALKKASAQLDGLASILKVLKKHGKPVEIKNVELTGDKPLFNTAAVADVDGAMYGSNVFLHRLVYPFRENLRCGHVDDFHGFSPSAEKDRRAIEKFIPAEAVESTYRADAILGEFVSRICSDNS